MQHGHHKGVKIIAIEEMLKPYGEYKAKLAEFLEPHKTKIYFTLTNEIAHTASFTPTTEIVQYIEDNWEELHILFNSTQFNWIFKQVEHFYPLIKKRFDWFLEYMTDIGTTSVGILFKHSRVLSLIEKYWTDPRFIALVTECLTSLICNKEPAVIAFVNAHREWIFSEQHCINKISWDMLAQYNHCAVYFSTYWDILVANELLTSETIISLLEWGSAADLIDQKWDWFESRGSIRQNLDRLASNNAIMPLVIKRWDRLLEHHKVSYGNFGQYMESNPAVILLLEAKGHQALSIVGVDWLENFNSDCTLRAAKYYANVIENITIDRYTQFIKTHWSDILLYIGKYHNNANWTTWDHALATYDLKSLIIENWDYFINILEDHWEAIVANPANIDFVISTWTPLLNMGKINAKYAYYLGKNTAAIAFIDYNWDVLAAFGKDFYAGLFENKCAMPLIIKHWALSILPTFNNNNITVKATYSLYRHRDIIDLIRYLQVQQTEEAQGWLNVHEKTIRYYMLKHHIVEHDKPPTHRQFEYEQFIRDYWQEYLKPVSIFGDINFILKHTVIRELIMDHWDYVVTIYTQHNSKFSPINIYPSLPDAFVYKKLKEQWPTLFNTYKYKNDLWRMFLSKSILFSSDYQRDVKEYFRSVIAEELIATVWHPRNIARFPALGVDPDS